MQFSLPLLSCDVPHSMAAAEDSGGRYRMVLKILSNFCLHLATKPKLDAVNRHHRSHCYRLDGESSCCIVAILS